MTIPWAVNSQMHTGLHVKNESHSAQDIVHMHVVWTINCTCYCIRKLLCMGCMYKCNWLNACGLLMQTLCSTCKVLNKTSCVRYILQHRFKVFPTWTKQRRQLTSEYLCSTQYIDMELRVWMPPQINVHIRYYTCTCTLYQSHHSGIEGPKCH